MTAPDELRECADTLGPEVPSLTGSNDSVGDIRANLHALLVESGLDDGNGDTRRTVALRTILEATARMDAGGSLEDLLGDMTTSVIAITNAERSCVVLVENVVEMEVRVATSASGGARSVEIEDLSHTVIRRVIESRCPLLLHDVYEDAELVERPSIASFELRSILCVPILRQGTLYGVLYADNASAAGSFDSVDLEVLTLFAKQAAAALQTNQLVVDVQTSLRHLKETQAQLVRGERLRALGELSSGVAHEFNNLLTSILARVQLISLGALAPSLRSDLTIIERACLDAASVVRRLQTFSRSERQGHFQVVDMKDVCQDAMDFLNPLWSNRSRRGKPQINVALDCAASYPVRGDATELREVLTNLIKNALEVLDGGGSIQVDVWAVDGVVKVAVADDGPGIPADTLPRIFEPFFTTKGERGTGLGLCLSQQIAERHRGSLDADSRPGTGTTFTLALPLVSESGTTSPHEDLLDVRHSGSRGTVVVVDDEETVREPLCGFLEKSGFIVQSASSAAEALRLCESSPPDLVVSDVSMPGMSGLEMCRTLRGQGTRARVILMSGKTDTNDEAAATLAGAAAFIPKPFTLSQLSDVVERVLGTRKEPSTPTREGLQNN
jgi:signal transduction histidine kinase/ActR/RegA family two-component response regulator